MNDIRKIVWLASYPKSGNTWFRAFLTALFNPGNPDIDINNLYDTTIASSRILFDEMTGVSSADLGPEEIDRLRPAVYRQNAMESNEVLYHKVHDAWTLLPDGEPLFPTDITKAVIYIIRNPLDVAVSFANHLNTTIDKTIDNMNNPGFVFCKRTDRLHNQLRQKLLTWSGHVTSWTQTSGLPVTVIRYEDMKLRPLENFSKAIRFIGLQYPPKEIEVALECASFARLKQQEIEKGFSEKSAASLSFFRKGISGDWKNVLTAEQVKRITEEHGEVMGRFGYKAE
jgi:aryl sulfotransferase